MMYQHMSHFVCVCGCLWWVQASINKSSVCQCVVIISMKSICYPAYSHSQYLIIWFQVSNFSSFSFFFSLHLFCFSFDSIRFTYCSLAGASTQRDIKPIKIATRVSARSRTPLEESVCKWFIVSLLSCATDFQHNELSTKQRWNTNNRFTSI